MYHKHKARQDFIEKTLYRDGRIKRKQIADEFKVSMPTATAELQRFMKRKPGVMVYDWHLKTYKLANTEKLTKENQ